MPGEIEFRREPLPPVAALEREWHALEAAACPSFFTSWHWIGTLLAAMPEASRPQLLRGLAGDRTVALALLGTATTRRRRGLIRSRSLYINETGDPHYDAITIEHNGILAPADLKDAVLAALPGWFAGLRDEVDELHFGGTLDRWPQSVVEDRGLQRTETAVPSYAIDLRRLEPSDGELYPILSANSRQQLRRAIRGFESHGPLQLTEATTVTEALTFFAAMKVLHCQSWERRGKRHAFSWPFFEPFHRLLLTRSFASGAVQILRVCAGDRTIGLLYNFFLGDRVHAYQSGFADAVRGERPGMVAHALAIRHAFRAGAHFYDFMAGRNQLKESFSTTCEPMLWQVVQQPRIAFRLENLGRRLHGLARTGTTVLPRKRASERPPKV